MVMNELRGRLSELESLSASLNEASDAFQEELKAIEAELARLSLGLEVEYTEHALFEGERREEYDEEFPNRCIREYRRVGYLAYGKPEHGRWGLLVNSYLEVFKRDGHDFIFQSSQPLLNAPRDIRLEAAKHIGALLDVIKETAREKIAAVQKARDKE